MNHAELVVQGFQAGATDLNNHADLLDRINVFPVMDGDTGANLSHTLGLFTGPGAELEFADLKDLKTRLGRPILERARGNSGVIFSQFLLGFLDTLGKHNRLTQETFLAALKVGRKLAHDAVSRPAPGTILTVMRDLEQIVTELTPIRDLETHATLENQLAIAVTRTKEQLPTLAQADVVDAGGLGLHLFACGLTLVLPVLSGSPGALDKLGARRRGQDGAPLGEITDRIAPNFLVAQRDPPAGGQYCVNILISLRNTAGEADWSSRFEALGSSVDFARLDDALKVHVHSDTPGEVERAAERLGRVESITIEDTTDALVRRTEQQQSEKVPLRIVSDSSMSLDFDTAAKHGITRLENFVNIKGRMVRDADIHRSELFSQMLEGRAFTTAQTSPEETKQFLDEQLRTSDRIVFIAVGNAYTGTQQTLRSVVKQHPASERITIVDSGAASGQQGLICLASARYALRASGYAPLIKYIERQLATCREYLVIDSLKYLARSGRIGRVKAAFASALSVKPIVGHGRGGAITIAKSRSHQAALEEIRPRLVTTPGSGPLLVMIEYTNNLSWAQAVEENLTQSLPCDTEIILTPLSSTSSVHMGPGTWGVVATRL